MHKAQDAPAGGQRVSRTAAVLLATGSFAMLVGAVFLLPFLLSVRAEQNDVFFSNLFIGPVFFAIGSTLLVGSLAGLGLKGWITFALAIGNPAAVVLLLWLASTTGLAGPGAIAATLWADAGIL